MATSYANMPIVTSGLTLCLDAGNLKSYPTTGTTWTDLSPNRFVGTLTNGPTFNSSNLGSIVFDGIDDYVNLGDNDLFSFTTGGGNDIPFSTSVWIKLGNSTGVIMAKSQFIGSWLREWIVSSSSGLFSILLFSSESIYIGRSCVPTLTNGVWYNLTSTYDGSKNSSGLRLYINGIIQSTTDISTGGYTGMVNTSRTLEIGRQNNPGNSSYLTANISNIQIYRNKLLSDSEILQNYNATKWRFQ